MKPLVLLDVDGVLCDFIGPLVNEINWLHGTNFTREDVTRWDPKKCLPGVTSKSLDAVYNITARKPGWCRNLQPYPGAVEGFRRLEDVANIHIVTTPFHSSECWMSERVEWLHEHFDIYPEDITFTSRKELIEGEYLIDDKTETCSKWSHAHDYGTALLWDTPHNRQSLVGPFVTRLHSWDTLIEFIK